jgi:hypothetical protein
MKRYGSPISVGVVKTDADSAIQEYMAKLKTAGAVKVIKDVKKQVAQLLQFIQQNKMT